jgi:hypothetical protein
MVPIVLIHEQLSVLEVTSVAEDQEWDGPKEFRYKVNEIWKLNNVNMKDELYKIKIKANLLSAIPQNTADVSKFNYYF